MKRTQSTTLYQAIGAGTMLLLLGAFASVYAQQKQHEPKGKPAKQQQAADLKGKQQADKPSKQGQRVNGKDVKRRVWLQHRSQNWQAEHRTWEQRGGYNGYRIPDNKFRSYFGHKHGFRVKNRTLVLYNGQPCFRHGNYWFRLVEPWPGQWADNWHEKDVVYIDLKDGGYYLYNRNHPNVGIPVAIYLN